MGGSAIAFCGSGLVEAVFLCCGLFVPFHSAAGGRHALPGSCCPATVCAHGLDTGFVRLLPTPTSSSMRRRSRRRQISAGMSELIMSVAARSIALPKRPIKPACDHRSLAIDSACRETRGRLNKGRFTNDDPPGTTSGDRTTRNPVQGCIGLRRCPLVPAGCP